MNALAKALDDAVLYMRRYYNFPREETAWMHALFAAYTWQHQEWRHQPRLVIDSPEWGSGKTTLAEDVLGGICCGLDYSENTTGASTFRSCEDADVVTIGLDEMDALWAKGASTEKRADILEVIRNGYRTTGVVKRTDPKSGKVKRYRVGKPFMVVGIAFWTRLDGATRSRCIRTTVLRADAKAAGLGRVGSPELNLSGG